MTGAAGTGTPRCSGKARLPASSRRGAGLPLSNKRSQSILILDEDVGGSTAAAYCKEKQLG